jgi:anti-sigma factor RsiW
MKPGHQGSDDSRQDAFDMRLVARIRRIADSQRAPQHLRQRVYADLAAQSRGWRRWRWDLIAAAAGGAAFAAAAALVIWLAGPGPRSESPVESWVDIALNQVAGDGFMQTDQPSSLQSWLESQVDYAIEVPDIPDAVLKGGRLAYLGGIRGAAVEYEVHGRQLTYLTVPREDVVQMLAERAERGDTLVAWTSRGYQMIMWRQGGNTRALVGPIPQSELYEIADHCRKMML